MFNPIINVKSMKKTQKIYFLLSAAAVLSLSSCSNDDPAPEETLDDNPPELITTVRLQFTNQNNVNDVVTVEWKDLDGDGGNAPVIGSLQLKQGVTYNLKTFFIDEPNAENITDEVKEEGTDHQVFYTVAPVANFLSMTVTDKDANNKDLGLEGTAQVLGNLNDAGTLKVTLKHQPGIKDGNIGTGETDVEVQFPVTIIAP